MEPLPHRPTALTKIRHNHGVRLTCTYWVHNCCPRLRCCYVLVTTSCDELCLSSSRLKPLPPATDCVFLCFIRPRPAQCHPPVSGAMPHPARSCAAKFTVTSVTMLAMQVYLCGGDHMTCVIKNIGKTMVVWANVMVAMVEVLPLSQSLSLPLSLFCCSSCCSCRQCR